MSECRGTSGCATPANATAALSDAPRLCAHPSAAAIDAAPAEKRPALLAAAAQLEALLKESASSGHVPGGSAPAEFFERGFAAPSRGEEMLLTLFVLYNSLVERCSRRDVSEWEKAVLTEEDAFDKLGTNWRVPGGWSRDQGKAPLTFFRGHLWTATGRMSRSSVRAAGCSMRRAL
eukprot:6722147-Prymnesium_polylepis.1